MSGNATFTEIAALVGEPARAAMLHALMDGRALTASELARVAGIMPQTASGHLARLSEAGLLAVEQQGRHRYHRLASPAVARMMESIMQVAAALAPAPLAVGPRDPALRAARTCYDHLAGRLGVMLADAMVAGGYAELSEDAGVVTPAGMSWLAHIGIDVDHLAGATRRRRILCRPCLDWSERRPHLAGAVGAALCAHGFAQGWIRRIKATRAVAVTPKGQRVLRDELGLRWE
jgi:DNA-binding transcriptional ArsR family regulator